MKKNKYIPKFFPGDIVYAIAFHTPKDPDEWSKDFAKVFKVKVRDVWITANTIEYNLYDPQDNVDWGAAVEQEFVFKTKEEALKKLTSIWKL